MLNVKQLKEMITSVKDIHIDSIYDFFLQENQHSFDFAHDQDLDDGCDTLMDRYEGWIYEMDADDKKTDKFLEKTRDDMSEHFFGALS